MMRLRFATVALLLFACACGGGGSTTSPSNSSGNPNSGNPNSKGSMSAVIDGKAWTATQGVSTASYSGGIFAIGGSDPNYILSFAVTANGGGTFVIPGADRVTGQPALQAGNNALLIPVVNGVAQPSWVADFTKGSGTIVLTSISATGATGSFSFALAPSNAAFGTAGTRLVSSGTFNVNF
jgi:hypothetical protein